MLLIFCGLLTSTGLTTNMGTELFKRQMVANSMVINNHSTIIIIIVPSCDIYKQIITDNCQQLGFDSPNIIFADSDDIVEKIKIADYIYIGEGEPKQYIKFLAEKNLTDQIKHVVNEKTIYLGSSAGAALIGDAKAHGVDNSEFCVLKDTLILPHYSYAEAQNFIANSDRDTIICINKTINIRDDESVYLLQNNNNVSIKRIRI